MNVVILENIRSAYNVGNIIRTADALGWQVRLT
jgi:tRNA G18 (ribose-2'-O)-methylase SpoU